MKLKKWEVVLIAAAVLIFAGITSANAEARELSDKLIRLHVVANSDTEEDQALKLLVRDEILRVTEPILSAAADREDAAELILASEKTILSAARQVIAEQGYAYDVTLSVCREEFPTTEYDTFSLPAGDYLSMRVIIGDGEGHNWWCVVFPTMCTLESFTKEDAQKLGLTAEQYKLITAETDGVVIKFRFMELISKLKTLFK